MKKNVRRLALFLAMVMALTASAFAMTQTEVDAHSTTPVGEEELQGSAYGDVKLVSGTATVTISFAKGNNKEKATITYTNTAKTAEDKYVVAKDSMYLVTMLTKNANGEYVPGDGNIEYIDQVTCTEDTTISFDVYPSAVKDSVIMIYGASGELLVAIIEGAYILGDVDGNGFVTMPDAMLTAQYAVGLKVPDSFNVEAAKVTLDGQVKMPNAMLIAQFAMKIISVFPAS